MTMYKMIYAVGKMPKIILNKKMRVGFSMPVLRNALRIAFSERVISDMVNAPIIMIYTKSKSAATHKDQ